MIELRDVALSYGDRPLFEGVHLELRHGEIALIRGRSGCGKTSLLRLLSRFLPPTRGGLTLDQRPYREFRYEELRTRIVYIHQSPVMEDNLSVLKNLLLPFSYHIHRDKEEPAAEEIQRLCAAFHLGPELIGREAGNLSVGEKQRVALIRAHLLRPEFMLLDEPLANLDEESADAIVAWIAQQTLARTGLVIASHQPVHGLPDERVRILEMSGGGLHERCD
jgi:ABC-type multidrug transport system ATPase subunit